jgi:hypothetical protein
MKLFFRLKPLEQGDLPGTLINMRLNSDLVLKRQNDMDSLMCQPHDNCGTVNKRPWPLANCNWLVNQVLDKFLLPCHVAGFTSS